MRGEEQTRFAGSASKAAKRLSADSMISFLGVGVTEMGLGEIDRQNIFWSEMLVHPRGSATLQCR